MIVKTHTFNMLCWPTAVTDAAVAYVTGETDKVKHIFSIILHNTHAGAVTVDIHLVQNNAGAVGTAADANKIYKVTLTADETEVLSFPGSESLTLDAANDTLQAVADVTGVVIIAVKGDEVEETTE